MTKTAPALLTEIFPLRLRPGQEMNFAFGANEVVAERVADGQRFSLRPWQYEMMRRFDGEQTFEEISREIHERFRGEFSAVGLTNFYQWLYDENLVVCECESIFELMAEDEADYPPLNQLSFPERVKKSVEESLSDSPAWTKQAIKISAAVLFSLALLRIAYITAPIFEVPVNHVYSSVETYFGEDAEPHPARHSVREVVETPVTEMQLAGRVEPEMSTMPEEAITPAVETSPLPEAKPRPTMEDLENLRREMAECRIRRDEFYIQNNEIGYRSEVQRMTALAKEIGEVEAMLD